MNYETPKTDSDSEQEMQELTVDEQRQVAGGVISDYLKVVEQPYAAAGVYINWIQLNSWSFGASNPAPKSDDEGVVALSRRQQLRSIPPLSASEYAPKTLRSWVNRASHRNQRPPLPP
jgi:hypothetical protein